MLKQTTPIFNMAIGSDEFLEEVSTFLSQEYGDSVEKDCLALTSGASQSFANILSLFTTKLTKIIVEDPAYFLALNVLEDHGFSKQDFISVPSEVTGFNVDYLEHILRKESARFEQADSAFHKFSYLLYFVPTFSNPTGRTTLLHKRERLIQLAREFDILIMCDDVYQMLPLIDGHKVPERLIAIDRAGRTGVGNVISNNSFSKIMAPGLRLGWIEASPVLVSLLSKSGLMNSGGSPNHIVSGLVATALKSGDVKQHLEMLKKVYSERMNALYDFLRDNLPHGVELEERPLGGFFIWITLPDKHDAFLIQQASSQGLEYNGRILKKQKMSYAPGRIFSSNRYGNCIRLSFAFYSKEKLLDGARRLCELLTEALAQ
ncbi:hypothetical protein HDU84_002962 [Entophlyctis sp. JEL0112]|nr:hypothetical protein HDU84_002962 [Entophlyctis sp. JEL0112]